MKVTGDANKSLTITMVRDRSRQLDYQILDDPTKTFVRKKDVEYRCPSGWLYSYTAYEQDDVYFALDKQGNLVAKVINHKTKRTRWQHWLAVSERNFQTVLSSVEPPEPKYIKKPVIAKPSVETKALALAIKTKLTALSPSGVKVVGIRHDKAQFMVKVVADSKQAIAELMQSTKATYPDSEPVLKTNRKNTSTVYAEIMVAKDGFK